MAEEKSSPVAPKGTPGVHPHARADEIWIRNGTPDDRSEYESRREVEYRSFDEPGVEVEAPGYVSILVSRDEWAAVQRSVDAAGVRDRAAGTVHGEVRVMDE